MRYKINLVKKIRLEEEKAEKRRVTTFTFCMVCFCLLALSLIFSMFLILDIENALNDVETDLRRVENEYRTYKATKMIVDKSDIELLDKLQHNRIFWSKKLASMARHLPENYWVTEFGYKRSSFDVKGYGYISNKQEQLLTMDDYLNLLRADTTFRDVFKNTYLNSTKRLDEKSRERISFEYSSLGGRKKEL
jgi:hypothetical protein